jgi:hypothetical protein
VSYSEKAWRGGRTAPLFAHMSDLVISLDHVPKSAVPPRVVLALREEFEAEGMTKGRFTIGEVHGDPTSFYFLWHDSGEVPISMLVERDHLTEEPAAKGVAATFLAKWKRQLSAGQAE